MTREEFKELVKNGPVILDGATGSNLQNAGMPVGVCPEQWILEHPQTMIDLQRAYVEAGTQILLAPTFTANRIKLEEYGLADKLVEMNQQLVAISKEAAGGKALVAGDITMTGQQLYPMGELQFEELVDIYKEQVKVVADAGADLFIIETMMSLQETRAAVLAIRETCDLPIMASMTYNEDGRSLYGTDPVTAVVTLQSLGADAVGMNCSTGPEEMLEPIRQTVEYAYVPVLAKPNAGLPELEDGVTVYKTTPEEFAEVGAKLVEEGVSIIGGCCGTTPAHIKALADKVKPMGIHHVEAPRRRVLTSERKTVEIDLDGPFMVIGERINPTGKKKLQAELREGSLNMVRDMARAQEENGAAILDVNMGMNGIDEKQMMLNTIHEVTYTVDCPLCIDSSHVDIIEAALRIYPGRALINSISLEKEKFEKLLPIAKKYGAMFILLPLSDEGLPKDAEEKRQIVRTILDAALKIGLHKEDIIVDGLVATVGANPLAALECFDTIQYCKDELGLATACGLSNISFGLPERIYVNSAFLTMAIAKGLTMAIANPSQDLLMNAAVASDMLLHKEGSDIRYINRMNQRAQKEAPATDNAASAGTLEPANPVFDCVLKGNKGNILKEVDKALAAGEEPGAIINGQLIPAINEVGVLFDKQIYFLPQLISSAQTMQHAIEYLEPMLSKDKDAEPKATIIIATVEGDIHDIGKNLVALMLRNYGYRVLDLGKDVAADIIVDTALKENAQIIGLSALMTTTMMRMKDVVELAKERGCNSKIIVGGAAITQSFADEIGADGYSPDAADCVKLVERLLEEM
ncbi:homocysteine S-methyltransferase family protein [Roseburia sp. CLA-AA-H204]|uniref:Methionine synthase n=1 Tax=Roseburia amylophila TaxID=2981794 RepID=A0AAW4WL17_9FIRM|nr:homocysteine S-methyltransferase family protein [Roseburia amylophila]MCC2243502.1 homocysteine S-methyltransferase family protein [Roseburia amylophila]